MPAFPSRLDNETSKAYAALCDYCALGPSRSLDKLVHSWTSSRPTKWLSVLKGWSAKYDWQVRVRAYDDARAAERMRDLRAAHRAEVTHLRVQAREDAKTLREMGRGMAALLAKRLDTLAPEGVEPPQLASLATAISKALVGAMDLDGATLGIAAILERLRDDEPDADTDEPDDPATDVAG